jgi:hypothetical protein
MDAVHRYEGTVNQVMGDGIMALFGAPLAHEDHAVRACYAALRMQNAVRRHSDEPRRARAWRCRSASASTPETSSCARSGAIYETRLFPELEYTFKHALTHEVAYEGLLHDRQRALHARVTEAIERLAPERLAEQAERLAYHALRGELWEKAVTYLPQVGLRAMARGANREAIAHLEQGSTSTRPRRSPGRSATRTGSRGSLPSW